MSLRFPEGSECSLTYSTDIEVHPGEYIVPLQRGERGRYVEATHRTAYKVVSVRLVNQKRMDSIWDFKYALRVQRCKPENIPKEAVRHPHFWNNRNKKKAVSRE